MSPEGRLPVHWRPRDVPLTPCAAWARGEAVPALVHRLLRATDEALGALSGVAGEGVVVVLGEEAHLPWADGVGYLGRTPEAPALLVPTALEPSVPLALLARALAPRLSTLAAPVALLPHTGLLVPCGGARPLARPRLEALLSPPG